MPVTFSVILAAACAGGCFALVGMLVMSIPSRQAMAQALGRLTAPVMVTSPDPPPLELPESLDSDAIEALMSGRVAFYSFPGKKVEEVSEPEMIPQTDTDIRIALATQKERLDGLANTIEREFSRMAEALGQHAQAVNNAFTAMKTEYVAKADLRAEVGALKAENLALKTEQARQGKLVYGTAGIMLTAMVVALVAVAMGLFK